jgi:hypothetical protein
MSAKYQILTGATCRAQAEFCRQLADQATDQGHRIMMNQIADALDRIAKDIGEQRKIKAKEY